MSAWGDVDHVPLVTIDFAGAGRFRVHRDSVPAFHALERCIAAHEYEVHPRYPKGDTDTYNKRRIGGSDVWSNHAYGIAIDVNWQSNPHRRPLTTDMPSDMVASVERVTTNNGKTVWRWGGRYKGKPDAMHYEIVCTPSDLATGLNPMTLPPEEDDEMVRIIKPQNSPHHFQLVHARLLVHVPSAQIAEAVTGDKKWKDKVTVLPDNHKLFTDPRVDRIGP